MCRVKNVYRCLVSSRTTLISKYSVRRKALHYPRTSLPCQLNCSQSILQLPAWLAFQFVLKGGAGKSGVTCPLSFARLCRFFAQTVSGAKDQPKNCDRPAFQQRSIAREYTGVTQASPSAVARSVQMLPTPTTVASDGGARAGSIPVFR